jgi:hypothetical protein
MQHIQKEVLMIPVLACLIGCQSLPPVSTKIVSEPPGARIEVNGNYVGVTPVEVTLPQSSSPGRLKEMILIRALPAIPGQQVQEKRLLKRQTPPTNVLFDMSLRSPESASSLIKTESIPSVAPGESNKPPVETKPTSP